VVNHLATAARSRSERILRLIGGLPPGTPVPCPVAYGWGWLVQ
jgi:hypothetical protein